VSITQLERPVLAGCEFIFVSDLDMHGVDGAENSGLAVLYEICSGVSQHS